jgi:Transposase and inactivated derivatives
MSVKKKALTTEQKAAALAEWEGGGRAEDIAKRLGVTAAAIYFWKKQRNKKALVAAPVNGHVLPAAGVRDAIIFLRKGKTELMASIRRGETNDLDTSHLMALLALNSLQGDK